MQVGLSKTIFLISSTTCQWLILHFAKPLRNSVATLLSDLARAARDVMNACKKYKDDLMEGTWEA